MSFPLSSRLMRALARGLLAAMLLAVLAPGISRALTGARAAGDWVEICTSEGMRWVQLQASAPEPVDAEDLLHALNFCGHCELAAERFAPLVPVLPVVDVPPALWAVPAYREAASFSADAPPASARGPPLLS